ncbi:MAG: hypothetical protein Ct9H300mP28_04690 [Pseudomonadota bacterium]|nr:MAG: hypothetical protein Ct9H300mP28_04690 [Pseudomonadota bacterium]
MGRALGQNISLKFVSLAENFPGNRDSEAKNVLNDFLTHHGRTEY